MVGKLLVSGAQCLKLNKHFGLFRKFGTDPMEAPRWDVWAFHFKRVERTDVPANICLGLPQVDPVREHCRAGREVAGSSTGGTTAMNMVVGPVAGDSRSKSSCAHLVALPGPMEKFVFAQPAQRHDDSTRTTTITPPVGQSSPSGLPNLVCLDEAGNEFNATGPPLVTSTRRVGSRLSGPRLASPPVLDEASRLGGL